MKDKCTAHKAEGLGSAEGATPNGRMAAVSEQTPKLVPVPQFANEQQFLDGLRSFMQAGRESPAPGVARVARFWERKICFSILVTQQRVERSKAAKAKRMAPKLQISVQPSGGATASPSSGQS